METLIKDFDKKFLYKNNPIVKQLYNAYAFLIFDTKEEYIIAVKSIIDSWINSNLESVWNQKKQLELTNVIRDYVKSRLKNDLESDKKIKLLTDYINNRGEKKKNDSSSFLYVFDYLDNFLTFVEIRIDEEIAYAILQTNAFLNGILDRAYNTYKYSITDHSFFNTHTSESLKYFVLAYMKLKNEEPLNYENMGVEIDETKYTYEELFDKYRGFIHQKVYEYASRGYEYEELASVAQEVLIKCALNYDPSRQIKFITFLGAVLDNHLRRTYRSNNTIRVSPNMIIHAYSVKNDLFKKLEREPTLEEIATVLVEESYAYRIKVGRSTKKLTPEEFQKKVVSKIPVLKIIFFGTDSLEKPLDDESDKAIIDCISDPISDNDFESVENRIVLDSLLDRLGINEQNIIKSRFGLNGDRPLSLEEIGSLYGVTRERVRQKEKKALQRLRDMCKSESNIDTINNVLRGKNKIKKLIGQLYIILYQPKHPKAIEFILNGSDMWKVASELHTQQKTLDNYDKAMVSLYRTKLLEYERLKFDYSDISFSDFLQLEINLHNHELMLLTSLLIDKRVFYLTIKRLDYDTVIDYLRDYYNSLSENESKVLNMYFGLNDQLKRNYYTISRLVGISEAEINGIINSCKNNCEEYLKKIDSNIKSAGENNSLDKNGSFSKNMEGENTVKKLSGDKREILGKYALNLVDEYESGRCTTSNCKSRTGIQYNLLCTCYQEIANEITQYITNERPPINSKYIDLKRYFKLFKDENAYNAYIGFYSKINPGFSLEIIRDVSSGNIGLLRSHLKIRNDLVNLYDGLVDFFNKSYKRGSKDESFSDFINGYISNNEIVFLFQLFKDNYNIVFKIFKSYNILRILSGLIKKFYDDIDENDKQLLNEKFGYPDEISFKEEDQANNDEDDNKLLNNIRNNLLDFLKIDLSITADNKKKIKPTLSCYNIYSDKSLGENYSREIIDLVIGDLPKHDQDFLKSCDEISLGSDVIIFKKRDDGKRYKDLCSKIKEKLKARFVGDNQKKEVNKMPTINIKNPICDLREKYGLLAVRNCFMKLDSSKRQFLTSVAGPNLDRKTITITDDNDSALFSARIEELTANLETKEVELETDAYKSNKRRSTQINNPFNEMREKAGDSFKELIINYNFNPENLRELKKYFGDGLETESISTLEYDEKEIEHIRRLVKTIRVTIRRGPNLYTIATKGHRSNPLKKIKEENPDLYSALISKINDSKSREIAIKFFGENYDIEFVCTKNLSEEDKKELERLLALIKSFKQTIKGKVGKQGVNEVVILPTSIESIDINQPLVDLIKDKLSVEDFQIISAIYINKHSIQEVSGYYHIDLSKVQDATKRFLELLKNHLLEIINNFISFYKDLDDIAIQFISKIINNINGINTITIDYIGTENLRRNSLDNIVLFRGVSKEKAIIIIKNDLMKIRSIIDELFSQKLLEVDSNINIPLSLSLNKQQSNE